MRKPDFIIAGTQKAGTTWLRSNLFSHPSITGSTKQLHFFDQQYRRGLEWYCKHFDAAQAGQLVGEKTTEYFDIDTADTVASRIAKDCPDTKVIVILREPVARTLSALKHMVNTGNELLPTNLDALLFEDKLRPDIQSFRYIDRSFYSRQLSAFCSHLNKDKLLVLVFEEDVVSEPLKGLQRTLSFLGVDMERFEINANPVNVRQMSRPGIWLMNRFRRVPFARSLVWRLDQISPFERWKPVFSCTTIQRLHELFAPEKEAVYQILGRRIKAWEET